MQMASVSKSNHNQTFHPQGHVPLPVMKNYGSQNTIFVPYLVIKFKDFNAMSPDKEWSTFKTT